MSEIEVWIAMSETGDYDVGCTEDEAMERWDEKCGGSVARRMVRLIVRMSPPDVPSVDVNVADDAGQTVSVKAN